MERADEVLARARVHTGLPADRRINLREQRRRRLEKSDAAQIECGGEAREVADDSAAERDDAIAPLKLRLGQKLQTSLRRL